ncbi:type IV pilus assembly protein PilM [Patescibacteria group bacterium]
MALTSKQIQAFGLDISDSSVKIMMLHKKGSLIRPLSFGAEIFSRGIVVKDEIKEPAKLAEIIKQTIEKAKPQAINTPYVIASLPESKSFIRMFDLPPMKKEEIPAAVKWEAEQHIPMSIDQVEMDWQIMDHEKKTKKGKFLETKKPEEKARSHRILLTAAPKDIVSPTVEVLKQAGLQPVALEIESISTARSCISPTLAQQNVMIVDIGTNRSGISILNSGLIEFTSSLAMAGVDITQNIMRLSGLSFAEAEKAKISFGLDQAKQQPVILQAIDETLKKITSEIRNTISYHQERSENEDKIGHILLCGGTSRLQGLGAYFAKELPIPVHLANPWINLFETGSKDLPPISSTDSLSFTAVIGLAQRGFDFNLP